jgi:DNA repair exonuclease SbcCD ATPase subunit
MRTIRTGYIFEKTYFFDRVFECETKMMSNDSLDYFERRIQRLESMYITGNQQQQQNGGLPAAVEVDKYQRSEKVLSSLSSMEEKLNSVTKKYPEVEQIIQKLNEIYPLIMHKRSSLNELTNKVNSIFAKKEEMQQNLNSLSVLKNLLPVINQENYAGEVLLLFLSYFSF